MPRPTRRLPRVTKTRSFRLALFLALLLNALGSPMAWAQWLGGGTHAHAAPASEMAPGCHGHDASSPGHPAKPGTLPCCDGSGCACAAAALMVRLTVQSIAVPHPLINVPFDTSALPAHPLDDSLRPPIV